MKAVICTIAGGLHIHTPGVGRWAICQCGNTGARWEDPEAGKLVVACRVPRGRMIGQVLGLGLNNQLLLRAVTGQGQAWEDYRAWHDLATDAPGYVFDKSRAGCWAVVFRIGSTGDTRWATDAEYAECFPAASAAGQAAEGLIRDILESLCRRDGVSLESSITPGGPARNYELADRLGIGKVFGLAEQEDHGAQP